MDIPDCEECLRLMVEAMAKAACDPQNLALLPSAEAEKATEHLRKLLGRPDDSLEQLAKLLASKAKARVGIYQQ
jgi:phage I-like protein